MYPSLAALREQRVKYAVFNIENSEIESSVILHVDEEKAALVKNNELHNIYYPHSNFTWVPLTGISLGELNFTLTHGYCEALRL